MDAQPHVAARCRRDQLELLAKQYESDTEMRGAGNYEFENVWSDRRRTRQRSFLVTQVLTATAIGPKAHFFTKTRQIARGPLGAHGDTGALPLVPSRQRRQFGQP